MKCERRESMFTSSAHVLLEKTSYMAHKLEDSLHRVYSNNKMHLKNTSFI